jgi:hypothetical protein
MIWREAGYCTKEQNYNQNTTIVPVEANNKNMG